MSTIDWWMLALIGVATPLICFGGLGLAFRAEQRGSVKKAPDGGRRATEHGVEPREAAARVQDRAETRAVQSAAGRSDAWSRWEPL